MKNQRTWRYFTLPMIVSSLAALLCLGQTTVTDFRCDHFGTGTDLDTCFGSSNADCPGQVCGLAGGFPANPDVCVYSPGGSCTYTSTLSTDLYPGACVLDESDKERPVCWCDVPVGTNPIPRTYGICST